jgi:protein-disulfide isomerase
MTTPLQTAGGRLAVAINEQDHTRGRQDAPVTLVEYGDYQCPYCAMAHPIVQELLRRRRDSVLFVFRHFPLTNVHPYAEMVAEAAEAAGTRGRFWDAHDWMYEHQRQLDPAFLIAGLDSLGLDGQAIAEEIRTHRYLGKVRFDFISGVRSGVNGTPTFFINGERHDGGYSLAELESAIDRAEAEVA